MFFVSYTQGTTVYVFTVLSYVRGWRYVEHVWNLYLHHYMPTGTIITNVILNRKRKQNKLEFKWAPNNRVVDMDG